jgi:hypothetical protein
MVLTVKKKKKNWTCHEDPGEAEIVGFASLDSSFAAAAAASFWLLLAAARIAVVTGIVFAGVIPGRLLVDRPDDGRGEVSRDSFESSEARHLVDHTTILVL